MAIAFDAASGRSSSAAPTLTIAHTCSSGLNRILFVSCSASGSNTITGVTYNSVAMTQVATVAVGTINSYLFSLANPASGTNNIVVTGTGGTLYGCGVSYTGAAQSGIPDSFNTANSSLSTSVSQSTTTIANNCWVVCGGICGNGGLSGGTNVTIRSSGTGDQYIGDNNAAKTPAGSITQTVNCNSGNNTIIMASFAPAIDFIPRVTII